MRDKQEISRIYHRGVSACRNGLRPHDHIHAREHDAPNLRRDPNSGDLRGSPAEIRARDGFRRYENIPAPFPIAAHRRLTNGSGRETFAANLKGTTREGSGPIGNRSERFAQALGDHNTTPRQSPPFAAERNPAEAGLDLRHSV